MKLQLAVRNSFLFIGVGRNGDVCSALHSRQLAVAQLFYPRVCLRTRDWTGTCQQLRYAILVQYHTA